MKGFPRADIDVYNARTKRGRLACIQTDHKARPPRPEPEEAESNHDRTTQLAAAPRVVPRARATMIRRHDCDCDA